MKGLLPYTINVKGRLVDLSEPQVMGILNVTPDSFYSGSRKQTEAEIRARISEIFDEGTSMIDVGAYSSRPDADDISPEEEMRRLRHGLGIVREMYPDAVVSVDTFRADVARMCVEEYGADIINDISGGDMDKNMFRTVAELGVPYILMHMKGTPQTMQSAASYNDLLKEMLLYFAKRVQQLRDLGQKDIIIDPGFGFAKTVNQNYELMRQLHKLGILELPLLVGISRKSMIYRLLGGTPADALNGTTVLNTVALLEGANILRVHDVKACVEAVTIVKKIHENI
ncbi:MAG: dihydropteroate synthase [Bacteroides sp.]|nr:dihydropteroate synthase [Roseburia sp.]MCM1347366.1 dihydropteroate synthase [Bacteroides sp.]MCM1421853.1 dihydropteroate synthase [Bacteroides sp.]